MSTVDPEQFGATKKLSIINHEMIKDIKSMVTKAEERSEARDIKHEKMFKDLEGKIVESGRIFRKELRDHMKEEEKDKDATNKELNTLSKGQAGLAGEIQDIKTILRWLGNFTKSVAVTAGGFLVVKIVQFAIDAVKYLGDNLASNPL